MIANVRISLAAVWIASLAVLSGCGPVQQAADESDRPQPAANPKPPAAAISMTAEEFVKAFNQNQAAEYEGREIELSGYMTHFDYSSSGGSYFFIGDEPKYLNGVKFVTPDDEVWARALPFQKIKAVGVYRQAIGLDNLTITEVSDDRIVATAEQLAKEVAEDEDAARKAYEDKFIEVRGKVVAVTENGSEIELAGTPEVAIYAFCARKPGFEPGADVKIVGQCNSVEDESIRLGQCLAITGK
jgi:hypothetical protein